MKPSPSYIHYRVEWKMLGPESPGQRFERKKFQKFFEELNKAQEFSGYDDFSYRPAACELAKSRGPTPQGGQIFSKIVYKNDELTVVEEWTDDSAEEFARKLKIVLDKWFMCFPETLAVVQTCVARALITPRHFDDSRHFLGGAVLGLESAIESTIQSRPHKIGFTFACQRQHGTVPMNLECAVSSWSDNRSVWIEVRAISPLAKPLNATNHDQAEVIFEQCTTFLNQEVLPLLQRYDKEGTGPTVGDES